MSSLTQKQIVILLAVIVVLLAAVIGVIVWQSNNAVPSVTAESSAHAGAEGATAGEGEAGAMPGAAPSTAPAVDFDPATAPAVPAEQTPEQYVTEYYELCAAGDYVAAYDMLPAATQAYYQSVEGFQSTLEGYGISGYAVEPQQESGEEIVVLGWQDAQGMSFGYAWTFVQGDDGTWLAKSRDMAGTK